MKGHDKGRGMGRATFFLRRQKGLTKPKNRTNSTKEFSGQFKKVAGSIPSKTRAWSKSHQKVHPNVRQNLCHRVSLWHLVCPQALGRETLGRCSSLVTGENGTGESTKWRKIQIGACLHCNEAEHHKTKQWRDKSSPAENFGWELVPLQLGHSNKNLEYSVHRDFVKPRDEWKALSDTPHTHQIQPQFPGISNWELDISRGPSLQEFQIQVQAGPSIPLGFPWSIYKHVIQCLWLLLCFFYLLQGALSWLRRQTSTKGWTRECPCCDCMVHP